MKFPTALPLTLCGNPIGRRMPKLGSRDPVANVSDESGAPRSIESRCFDYVFLSPAVYRVTSASIFADLLARMTIPVSFRTWGIPWARGLNFQWTIVTDLPIIVAPVYNEEGVPRVCTNVYPGCSMGPGRRELILVNDGSRDGSAEVISRLHAQDPRVKGLSFPRNFGFRDCGWPGLTFRRDDGHPH